MRKRTASLETARAHSEHKPNAQSAARERDELIELLAQLVLPFVLDHDRSLKARENGGLKVCQSAQVATARDHSQAMANRENPWIEQP